MIKIPIVTEFNNKGLRTAVSEFKKLEGVGAKAKFLAGKAFSPAAMGAYAAAATAAAAAAFDAANAAAQDQKEQAVLAQALKNTVGATDEVVASTEKFITAMQMASGVSDTDFRVGLQNLTRATGDLQASQELLKLALDISVGSGKDLSSVTLALGKAFNGQVSSLKKLGLPLSEATVKTNDFEGAMAQLNAKFGGSAQANAESMAGKMAILSQKMSELKENIGVLLLPVIDSLTTALGLLADTVAAIQGKTEGATKSQSTWGKLLGATGTALKWFHKLNGGHVTDLDTTTEATDEASKSTSILTTNLEYLYDALGRLTPQAKMAAIGLTDLGAIADALGLQWRDTAKATSGFSSSLKANVQDPLADFLKAVQNSRKEIQNNLMAAFDLGSIYQANEGKFKPFMKSFTAQASQFKNYASNLVKLKEMGLSPIAIQSIMQMDLATGSQFAADLLAQSDVLKNIGQINRAYAGVNAAASAAGFALGGGTGTVNQNITIVNPNPKAVVQALREYGRNTGPIQIATTGSF